MKSIIVIFFILSIVGCSSIQTLPANYFYKGSYIDIHSPNQDGWIELEKSQSKILFGKKGKEYNESYVAGVWFFPLKPTKNSKEFFLLIKKEMLKIGNKNRFTVVEFNSKLSEKRKYPCVAVKSLLKDNNAKMLRENEFLLMHEKALYCRDPKKEKAAFMIKYSFRGKSKYPNLDLEADSFINGVKFKEYK